MLFQLGEICGELAAKKPDPAAGFRGTRPMFCRKNRTSQEFVTQSSRHKKLHQSSSIQIAKVIDGVELPGHFGAHQSNRLLMVPLPPFLGYKIEGRITMSGVLRCFQGS